MNVSASSIVDPETYVRGVPHDLIAQLRATAPVLWVDDPAVGESPGGTGFWAVLRHADVRHVLRSPELFSSQLGGTQVRDPATPADLAYVRRMMLNLDPPEHSRLRGLLTKAFTPRAITRISSAHPRVGGRARR